MAHGPVRRSSADPGGLAARNPEDTLNIQQLLQVCGTATNAFVNLAQASDLHARRLLLLDQFGLSKHVVVEVRVGDRWVVVDPSHHFIMRLPDGRFPSRATENPAIFRTATEAIPNYPPSYTYESTVHVRLARIPWIGKHLRGIFNFIWPSRKNRSIGRCSWNANPSPRWWARSSFCVLPWSRGCFSDGIARAWWISRSRLRDQIVRVGHVVTGVHTNSPQFCLWRWPGRTSSSKAAKPPARLRTVLFSLSTLVLLMNALSRESSYPDLRHRI